MLLEEFPFEPGFRLTDGDLLNKVAAEPAYSVDNSVTATGTNQNTAYNIRATVTSITAGGDQTGVRLPFPKVGRVLYIMNYTATSKKVYPFDTDLINGASFADIGFAMAAILFCTGSNSWMAAVISGDTITGDIILEAADADTPTGDGHSVTIGAGSGGTTSGDGGSITLTGGSAQPTGTGGFVRIRSGPPGVSTLGEENFVDLASADTSPGNDSNGLYANSDTGSVSVRSGDANVARSGDVSLSSGSTEGFGKDTGEITIFTGNVVVGPSTSGIININTGESFFNTEPCNSGDLTVRTGTVLGTGKSGDVRLSAGAAPSGTPGTVNIGGVPNVTGSPPGLFPNGPVVIQASSTEIKSPITIVDTKLLVGTTTDNRSTLQAVGPLGTPVETIYTTGVTAPVGLPAAVAPNSQLLIQSQDGSGGGLTVTSVGSGGFSGMRLLGAGGTSAAPAALAGGNAVGALQFGGYDGANWNLATVSLNGVVETGNNWAPGTSTPMRFLIRTTPVGSTASVATLALTAAGNLMVTAGAGGPDPGHKIHVNGNGQFILGVGVWGVPPPAAQPTVTGSRGGNAALASLITAIAATGMVIDGTTA